MLKARPKSIISLIAVFTLCTCIDPYSPKLNGYESLLVVDGLITDENASYTVKLSRTIQEQDATPLKVSGATVYITNEEGIRADLVNVGEGIYKTDSILFRGVTGKSYILHILTPSGDKYESDPYLMQSVPDIDRIYFAKEQELFNNGSESLDGIRIYLNSKKGVNNKYYRWDFEENWKFRIPTPQKYVYINDSTINTIPNVKYFCWKNRKSNEVLINTINPVQTDKIEKEPLLFIATKKSDRLLLQYSINVRQYSISKKEYDFWNDIKRIDDRSGDIFAIQPFPVISNIHNINNSKERVLGYFKVSAVKQKRIFISFNDISGMNLPYFYYGCERIEMSPDDFPQTDWAPPITWDELYEMYVKSSVFYFIEPKYKSGTLELEKLVFAKPECADCELTGTLTKPDFWVDSD